MKVNVTVYIYFLSVRRTQATPDGLAILLYFVPYKSDMTGSEQGIKECFERHLPKLF